MAAKSETHIEQVGQFLKKHKGTESIRSVARRAGVSHSVFADLLAGKSMPKATTLKKIGKALECNETTLLRLAGYLEDSPYEISDPRALFLARRLDGLPNGIRERTIEAMGAQLDVIYDLIGSQEVVEEEEEAEGDGEGDGNGGESPAEASDEASDGQSEA